jgi:hypothetical protein
MVCNLPKSDRIEFKFAGGTQVSLTCQIKFVLFALALEYIFEPALPLLLPLPTL